MVDYIQNHHSLKIAVFPCSNNVSTIVSMVPKHIWRNNIGPKREDE